MRIPAESQPGARSIRAWLLAMLDSLALATPHDGPALLIAAQDYGASSPTVADPA